MSAFRDHRVAIQLFFSLARAFDVLTELAVISVIQREFSEKLRRPVSPDEAHMTE